MNPLVSCCLITYNHVEYIEQAIESILMQQTDFEYDIIIADDCSIDGTKEKIKYYAEKYPDKIKPIIRDRNVGPAQNFIELLNAGTGKYIAYLEGDDYWTHNLKLQEQAIFLEANDDFAISSHNTTVHAKNNKQYLYSGMVKPNILRSAFTLVDYLQNHFIHSSSLMFRKSMLKPFPHWYANAFAGDGFLILLLALEGKIDYINRSMSVYRHNSNSVSNYNSRIEITKNFEKHFRLFDNHSQHQFSKEINEKVFSLHFNLNYYNNNYLKKMGFFINNFLKIIRAKKTTLPLWGRYKFLLPAQILKTRINVNEKKIA